ncbi:eukaryotic translation initiation factor 2 subunit beta [Brevipalpus obovatus]|uniref:eukaryotic translation initiation factor 2 subunit beta n=1 Tax=Brevipalpus obovatus TaxID=246614 RepID=UPI003D9EFE0D
MDQESEQADVAPGPSAEKATDNLQELLDEFSITKKKKKKKDRVIRFDDEDVEEEKKEVADTSQPAVEDEGGEEGENEIKIDQENEPIVMEGERYQPTWIDSDRDYDYKELLQRVFFTIKEKNPDIISGEKKRLVMRPPQVLRVGTKKTSFANFLDICKSLHREAKHLQAFLLAELGTNGSVDANNQLIIKGRFQQKQIENVLRRYIKEYVACQTCRSPETILQKDTRLFFLQCETCGSRRSVVSIKSGFQAVTGKRAAIRAKTA